jgi:hypothetical protein
MMPLMEEEFTRGTSRHDNAEESGWVTTEVAAKALHVAPRTVRAYLEQGRLKGKAQGNGVRKTWLVTIESVQALRAQRIETGDVPQDMPRNAAEDVTANIADVVRGMAQRLESRAAESEGLRVRLELTEKAESTLQAERDRLLVDLDREREERSRERERADQEREKVEQLEQQSQQAQEEAQRLREELEAERSKGFWRRLFGG